MYHPYGSLSSKEVDPRQRRIPQLPCTGPRQRGQNLHEEIYLAKYTRLGLVARAVGVEEFPFDGSVTKVATNY